MGKNTIPLAFIVAGILGAGACFGLATHHNRRLDEAEARLVSFEQFATDRVMEREGTLNDYNRFLELRERYKGLPKEYYDNSEIQEAQKRVQSYRSYIDMESISFFMACSAILTGIGNVIYGPIKRKFKRKE